MTTPQLAAVHAAFDEVRHRIGTQVIGQEVVVNQVLVAILAGQHCLLEAAPGSAKNVLVTSLARLLDLSLLRVHCTPDMTPAELVPRNRSAGEEVGDGQATGWPHVLLVDDISRLPPASRVVIDQAMQEGVVQVGDQRFEVPNPFIVLASKYRQDEEPADVVDEPRDDRFMLKIAVRLPGYHEEFQVADRPADDLPEEARRIEPIIDAGRLLEFQRAARGVLAPAHVVHYALRLVRSTRVDQGQIPDFAYEWIGVGAGPRATHHLLTAAKMHAALAGRDFASTGDVQAMIHSTLRHRLVANQNARANGITPDRIIDRLVYEIPVRIAGDDQPAVEGEAPKFDVTSDNQWLGE